MADLELSQAFFQRHGGNLGVRHFDRILEKARSIEDKIQKVPALHRFWKDVLVCLELIRDYRLGRYRNLPTWAIAAVAFGLLYLIDPLELVPDVIPVVGYVDDVAVIALILKLVKTELARYAAWKQAHPETVYANGG
ncbi:hypothetical protein JCM13664_08800 [Methylothermus subterraneus]